MIKKDIKGIIFDLDGVLLDSEYYQWQGWVEPLRKHMVNLTKEMYSNYIGKTGKQVDEELIKDFELRVSVGTLLAAKKILLEKWFNEKSIPLMPFAKETIKYFISNPQFKVALCSGGPKKEIMTKLEKNDLVEYFPIVIAGDDVPRSKPWPDIYLLAVEKLGLKPEECLALEDTQYGLEAAKSAGVNCFVIPNEYSAKQDFSKADKVSSSLKEIIEFFEN